MSDLDKERLSDARKVAEERKEEECAICLEVMGPKKTILLCSHSFCVNCIINFVQSKTSREIDCPTCRRKCTFLLLASEDESIEGGPDKEQRAFIRDYNERIYENVGFISKLENLPFILHRLFLEVIGSCGLSMLGNHRFYCALFLLWSMFGDVNFTVSANVLTTFDYVDELSMFFFVFLTISAQGMQYIRDRNLPNVDPV